MTVESQLRQEVSVLLLRINSIVIPSERKELLMDVIKCAAKMLGAQVEYRDK